MSASAASCIYPIIGHHEYGWSFIGSEINPTALDAAKRILRANRALAQAVTLRRQSSPMQVFQDVVLPGEVFDLSICNPPFHASLAEAQGSSQRKWRNLGKEAMARKAAGRTPVLNFGGQGAELWCAGGEVAFIGRMVEESARIQSRCLWFTSMVSKEAHLPAVIAGLKQAKVRERRIIDMAQGQKRSRIVAWTFLDEAKRKEWRATRWEPTARPGG
jgi:23S rRNA (adenine1618-N6)-methyltransferase